MLRHMVGLVGWFALVAAIAATAAQFSPGHWYASLQKPAGTPPGWVFGPVWSVLYIMMAVAVWLVWNRPGQPPLFPIGIFILQLMAPYLARVTYAAYLDGALSILNRTNRG